MKPIFLLSLVTAFSLQSALAQNYTSVKDSTKTLHELGVNATFFVANFLTFSGNAPVSVDPYAIQYKILAKGRDGVRFGIGANYRSLDQSEDGDINKSSNTLVNVRLGYEHRTDIAKKWKVFFGADVVGAYGEATTITENGFQEVTVSDFTRSIGAGAVFGIQFFANKRISLGTETSAQFLMTEFENKTEIGGNLPESESSKAKQTSFNFVLPTSIYVNIALGKKK